MKQSFYFGAAVIAFAALSVFSKEAADGVRTALRMCAESLVPALFPLFVLAKLLGSLGMPPWLERRVGTWMSQIFHMPACAARALLLGLSGGYPLGAHTVADLSRRGEISRKEGETLLAFCNNAGPAFIFGAVGSALQSLRAAGFLYIAQILGALLTGWIFCRKGKSARLPKTEYSPAEAPDRVDFAGAVTAAAGACLSVCGYVCFFSAVTALLGGFSGLSGSLRALALGFFELGGGIGALNGLAPRPLTMAIAGFMLGWGGISVHFQTAGAVAGTDIKCARHLMGRALCGAVAAVISFFFGFLC